MKNIWQILNSITIALLALVMLIFLGVIGFDYFIIPLIFSSLFFLFFILINWYCLNKKSFVFLVIAIFAAIGYEFFAKKHHFFSYQEDLFTIEAIPVCVILTWFAFFSHIHHYNNGFLTFLGLEKPKINKQNVPILVGLIIADSLQTALMGQLLDFVLVLNGFWTWEKSIVESGYYEWYIGLFFLVVGFVVSLVFRTFEYFSSTNYTKKSLETYLIFNITHLLSFLIGTILIINHFKPFYLIPITLIGLSVIVYDALFKKNKKKLES
jgi:hypothetical protein